MLPHRSVFSHQARWREWRGGSHRFSSSFGVYFGLCSSSSLTSEHEQLSVHRLKHSGFDFMWKASVYLVSEILSEASRQLCTHTQIHANGHHLLRQHVGSAGCDEDVNHCADLLSVWDIDHTQVLAIGYGWARHKTRVRLSLGLFGRTAPVYDQKYGVVVKILLG